MLPDSCFDQNCSYLRGPDLYGPYFQSLYNWKLCTQCLTLTSQDYTLANLDGTLSHGMNYMGRKPHQETPANCKKFLSQMETPAVQNLICPLFASSALLSSLSSLCDVFNKPFSCSGLKSHFIHLLVNTQSSVLLQVPSRRTMLLESRGGYHSNASFLYSMAGWHNLKCAHLIAASSLEIFFP